MKRFLNVSRIVSSVAIVAMLFIAAAPAFSQRARGGGSMDPNAFDLLHSGPDINQNTKVFTLRAQQTPDPAVRNLAIAIDPAQSNCTAVTPTAYTVVNPSAIDQMSITDGGVYSASDPVLSVTGTGGMPVLALADLLVSGGLFDRVMFIDGAAGGTSIADWDTGIESTKLPMMISRLRAKGWLGGTTNVTTIFILCQGEQDTNLGTSQAAYAASLSSIIAKSRTLGFAGTWFVPTETWYNGAASAAIAAAQASVVNHGSGIWAGPNLDSLVGTACNGSACRQIDNLHFSDAGSRGPVASFAVNWKAALHLFGAPF